MSIIPEKDVSRPLNGFPYALSAIIGLNILVFIVELAAGDSFIDRYSLKPYEITHGHQLDTLLTSMFMHASLVHIGGNMIFLWVFGDELEVNYLGAARFVVFYLLCGFAAEALQIAVEPNSMVPNLGASGAIAGVMGGFILVFPHDKIQAVIFPFIFLQTRITAAVFIGIWFLIQLVSGIGSITTIDNGGVAYFAHVGGFIAGFLLIKPFGIGAERPAQYLTEP